jgi:hypothetical protein
MAFFVACPHCFTPNRVPGPLRRRKTTCVACRRAFTTEPGLYYRFQRLGGERRLLGWLAVLALLAGLALLAWWQYPALRNLLFPARKG